MSINKHAIMDLMTDHQLKQVEIINQIEQQVKTDTIQFSTIPPVEDYVNDPRVCLVGAHFAKLELLVAIEQIINTLKEVEPSYYYYPHTSLHITIKNVRVVNNPPHFSHDDIKKAANVFSTVVPKHKAYRTYFYRLLLFKNNLSLIGTTDQWYDDLVLDLDEQLKAAGMPDDKQYVNSKYFFNNMTLARFPSASEKFIEKVNEISSSLAIDPYLVDSISLVAGNAAFINRLTIQNWELK